MGAGDVSEPLLLLRSGIHREACLRMREWGGAPVNCAYTNTFTAVNWNMIWNSSKAVSCAWTLCSYF